MTSTNILGMYTCANVTHLYTRQEESAVIQTVLRPHCKIFNGRASQALICQGRRSRLGSLLTDPWRGLLWEGVTEEIISRKQG